MHETEEAEDWGFYDESNDESDSGGSSGETSGSNTSGQAPGSSEPSSASSSTSGLQELNTWLYDSCELGPHRRVAAWMRAGAGESTSGRRRCYFTTGDDFRSNGPEDGRRSRQEQCASSSDEEGYAPRARPHRARAERRRPARSRSAGSVGGRQLPQQLWCVTPFERRQVDSWLMLETALTPRLCPRVFSREFVDPSLRTGGVIVGASLGSIRVVRHAVTGWRHVEYLLMVSVGDSCRRSWRSHQHFAAHARRRYRSWAPQPRAAWTVAEGERRWRPCVDDYPYVASRHAAYENVVREILFHADSPEELLDLAGVEAVDLPPRDHDSSEEEPLFGVEVADEAEPAPAPDQGLAERLLGYLRPRAPATPLATLVRPPPRRTPFPSMSCLACDCGPLGPSSSGERAGGARRNKPPLAAALSEAAVGLSEGRSKHHLYAETRAQPKSESSIGSSAGRLAPQLTC